MRSSYCARRVLGTYKGELRARQSRGNFYMCDDAPGGPNDDPCIRHSLSSHQQACQLFSESDAMPMSTSPLL